MGDIEEKIRDFEWDKKIKNLSDGELDDWLYRLKHLTIDQPDNGELMVLFAKMAVEKAKRLNNNLVHVENDR